LWKIFLFGLKVLEDIIMEATSFNRWKKTRTEREYIRDENLGFKTQSWFGLYKIELSNLPESYPNFNQYT